MDIHKNTKPTSQLSNDNTAFTSSGSSFLATANNEMVFLWRNFEHSGKIEDYLRYKVVQKDIYDSPKLAD